MHIGNLSALEYNRRKWTWRSYNGLKMVCICNSTADINTPALKCHDELKIYFILSMQNFA